MTERHLEPGTPAGSKRWAGLALRALRIALAVPVIALMIGFAKMTQYAAIDAFGGKLGADLAALLGLGPVFALYYWAAIRLPKLNTYGLSRG